LKTAREKLRSRVELAKFLQYVFDKQWTELKNYCAARNIRILGDLPVYVNYDSADVWTHVELFNLDAEKKPLTIAGVPPDYFSETGQLWGNPVYRWPAMKQSGYAWWISRLKENFRRFDFIRIDHLRGFVGYWEVPAGETTSVRGRWVPGPGDDFFKTVLRHFPVERFVAEDLGTITDDVRELIKRFNLPGMKVLLFAFGPELPHSPYAPHNHVEDCLVYTGTHDNNTIRGWYESELTDEDRERINRYLGRKVGPEEIAREMVRLAMTSVARTAIFPLQDLLGLGPEARMNHPASPIGNWRWRVKSEQLTPELAAELHELTHITGRT